MSSMTLLQPSRSTGKHVDPDSLRSTTGFQQAWAARCLLYVLVFAVSSLGLAIVMNVLGFSAMLVTAGAVLLLVSFWGQLKNVIHG